MNADLPLISVVIPAYNQAIYIDDAIRSVLAQTYRIFEIIVVDDGSTDNTAQVASQFGQKIRYIRQENQGLAGARNTGIRNSNGSLIALLDSDDQWLPNYLEKMVGLSDRFPEAAVYYCQAHCMDVEGHDLPRILGGPVKPPEKIYQTLLRSNFIIPSTILMNRSVVLKAGLFDQSLRSCEDWDLWFRLLPKHKFLGTMDCLVRYRLHGSSLSANLDGMQKAARSVMEKNFGSENGDTKFWSFEKRRAYGGLYRYQLITSIQRSGNWRSGPLLLSKALHADPTLALDLPLFYDLALGSQPVGFRGTPCNLNFFENASNISVILSDWFNSAKDSRLGYLKRKVFGTANFALGLVATNTGQYSISRKYFVKALYYRPVLFLDSRMNKGLMKSFLSLERN